MHWSDALGAKKGLQHRAQYARYGCAMQEQNPAALGRHIMYVVYMHEGPFVTAQSASGSASPCFIYTPIA